MCGTFRIQLNVGMTLLGIRVKQEWHFYILFCPFQKTLICCWVFLFSLWQTLINYYNTSKTIPQAKLGNGMSPTLLEGRAPQVALFSSRGPCVKDFNLQDADVLKPNIVAPGSLIWGAWTPIGTDEADDFQGNATSSPLPPFCGFWDPWRLKVHFLPIYTFLQYKYGITTKFA